MDLQDCVKYCRDVVRQSDETRFLALSYVAASERNRLLALYAIHEEIRRIPSAVREAPLGEIRLEWWREVLDELVQGGEARQHPVVQLAAQTGLVTQDNKGLLEAAIDGRARLLYGDAFASMKELWVWLQQTEGYLALLREEVQQQAGEHQFLVEAEAAYALVPLLQADTSLFSEQQKQQGPVEIEARFAQARAGLNALEAKRCAAHLHLAAIPVLLAGNRRLTPLRLRWRLFTTMLTGKF